MAPKIYRLSSSGAWEQIKKLYRLSSSGTWEALKKVWRLSSSGVWEIIFSPLATPSIKSATKPLLYFRDTGGYETASSEIAAATGSNLTSPAAYDSDKVFLIRGNWNEEPISFYMRIQKSQTAGFTSGVSTVNGSSSVTRTYATYSDSNYADEVPLSSANRYTITKADVRDGYYFRGYIEATNDINLMGSYSTEVVLPRMYANVSFAQNLDGSYGTSLQTNGGTFTWSYSGNSTIQAQDISEQLFLVYPLNNTSGNALYSTTIFAGTGTNSPTSTVTFTSANLSPNTQYTIVIKTTMQDGWSANANTALRTIITDQKSFTTAQAKPATPVITSATDVGTNRPFNNGAVSLVWSQADNGTTITGYKIEYTQGPGYITYVTLVNNTGNSTTSGTFTGLSSNTNYKFRVTAIGSQANSDPSSDSNIVLITTVPDKPTGVSAVAGNASADVSFTAPTLTGGKNLLDYRATSTPGGITATEVISPIPVTGLTNYTDYTFTVAARNANGYSAESNSSATVTPKLPLPVGSGTVTIASNSNTNYIYQITSYGTWSNSATTYDYEWQTSSDGGTTWTTRASSTNVATIPNYNASLYKAQNIRLRVYGRNQTGPAITPLISNTLTIFYTTPVINTFSVTGGELISSYSYTYSTDDPSPSISLEYKLSSSSTWTSIVSPSSPGTVILSAGTYDFRFSVTNSANGAFRVATSTVSSVVVSNIYSFSFGNILYPSTNGHIGLTGGSTTTIPSTGKYLAIFPGDYVGNTGASPGYMLVWSDSTKYVVRFDGYRFGFVGQAAYRLEWMATFYSNQSYVDVKIITKGSSISGGVTSGLYKDGVLVAALPGPYTLSAGSTFRVNFDGSTGSFGITYDEISITAPNDIMTTSGTLTGSNDDGYYTITTAQNIYRTPVVTFGTPVNNNTSLGIPFTESGGCDYVSYIVRTGSHTGTQVASGNVSSTPLSVTGLTAGTTYYITATPYNYKNQAGSQVQFTSQTTPPAPTITFSNVTTTGFTVSWSASSATSYNVDIYNSSTLVSVGSLSTPTMPANGTTSISATVTGLTSGAQYTALVSGNNSGGTGPNGSNSQYTNVTLSYLGNSNTGGSVPASTTHSYGASATVSGNTGSLTRTYATWAGWSLFADGSGTTYGPGYTTTITMNGSQSLYARWLANTPGTPSVTVGYTPSTTTTSSNSLVFNPVNFGTDTSSVLLEWGTSTAYGNSTSVTTNGGSYTTTANLAWNTTYYWRARGFNPLYNNYGSAQTGTVTIPITQWTVNWNATANGGTVSPTSSTVNNGSSVTAPTATRSGYTFNGWYTASSGGTLVVSGGSSYTPTASITLYAQFSLIQIAPNNGNVAITKSSGPAAAGTVPAGTLASARWGDVYAVTTATASGTPSPTILSYQWQRYSPASDTWNAVSGETSSSFTVTTSHTGASFRCVVTFTNGVSPDLATPSNTLSVANPTVTGIISYYRSTLAISATKSNGYPTRPPITTGALNNTYFYVVWYVEGYNMQGMNSKTVLNSTVQATATASDSLNIYSFSQTIGDSTSYSGGIYRNTGAAAAGSGNSVALRVQPTAGTQGTGITGFAQQTNAVTNNNQGGPVNNTFSQVTF